MKTFLKTWLMSAAVLAGLVAGQAAAAGPDHFYASSERFGYTGTVSVYNTLEDATLGTNARCSGTVWPQRDGAIFAVKNAPEYYTDSNLILTNWFANNGASPSDTNEGFFQLYDDNADAWKTQKASWSRDRNKFTVKATGRNATYGSPDPKDYARLWNACAPAGSGEATSGTFLNYTYMLIATGLNGVESPPGFIKNSTNASDYSGHFSGIFQNQSTTSPDSNGYYVFDIQFNNTSWAAANNCGYDGGSPQVNFPCTALPAFPDEFGGKK